MPLDLNPHLVKKTRNLTNVRNQFRVRLGPLTTKIRSTHRLIKPAKIYSPICQIEISNQLDSTSTRFLTDGFDFIENFFGDNTLNALVDSWPPRRYFSPIPSLAASYFSGFQYSDEQVPDFEENLFPQTAELFRFLHSAQFCAKISNFCGDGFLRQPNTGGLSWANGRSILLPHVDEVRETGEPSWINIIFFLKTSGFGRNRGATGLYKENNYDLPLFIPSTTENSALVYDATRHFHGFPYMSRFATRWSFTQQYVRKE
jgi:hypothetical protein